MQIQWVDESCDVPPLVVGAVVLGHYNELGHN